MLQQLYNFYFNSVDFFAPVFLPLIFYYMESTANMYVLVTTLDISHK